MEKLQSILGCLYQQSKRVFAGHWIVRVSGIGLCSLWLLLGTSTSAHANNPGGHMAQLTWQDTCAQGQTCSYNIYRSTSPGSCGTGKSPFANSKTLAYEDDTVLAGTTYYYSVTQFISGGGESSCSTELQIAVSNTQGSAPTVPQGQGN